VPAIKRARNPAEVAQDVFRDAIGELRSVGAVGEQPAKRADDRIDGLPAQRRQAVDDRDLAAESRRFGVDRASIGPVFSAGLVGLTLGALGFGLLGDRWGVKRAFIFCGVMFGVFSLLTAFAQSLTVLLVYRFLAGLALGGAS
jgi:MFS family permease